MSKEFKITDELEFTKTIYAVNGDFQSKDILTYLLAKDVVFINNGWWNKEDGIPWPEDHISVHVNCNDIFAWGTADSEDITYSELPELLRYYRQDPNWGSAAWCIKKRKMRPQEPVEKELENSIWDLKTLLGEHV
jgi:hypothetical protein